MNKKTKLYQKWWFWVILGMMFLGFTGILLSSSTSSYHQEYIDCKAQIYDIQVAWNEYVASLSEYCTLDPYNNICIAMSDII